MDCNVFQVRFTMRILILWIIFQISKAAEDTCMYKIAPQYIISNAPAVPDDTLQNILNSKDCGQKCCDNTWCSAAMYRNNVCLLYNCDNLNGGCMYSKQPDSLISLITVSRRAGEDAALLKPPQQEGVSTNTDNSLISSTNKTNLEPTNDSSTTVVGDTGLIKSLETELNSVVTESLPKGNISSVSTENLPHINGGSGEVKTTIQSPSLTQITDLVTEKSQDSILTTAKSSVPTSSSTTTVTSKSTATTSTSPPTKSTTVKQLKLKVSTDGNQAIRLPKDSVTIHAFVTKTTDVEYDYHWGLIKHPEDFHATQSGSETDTLKLTTLTQGDYEFKVEVHSDNAYGEAFVNVTVLPKLRVNTPPVAVILPPFQELTLPTDSTVLDGSKSHDDDGIETYEWEKVEGPLQADINKDKNGNLPNEKVLKITGLIVGSYTFKLTVTDTDKVSNSTQATIIVKKKIDNPPIANAGSNQVIHMPHNSAVLCGNDSTDDWGIVNYKWSLSPDTKKDVVDMQGAREKCIELSNLEVGDYTFQLTVTDEAGQEDTAKVTIIVQPESNHPPVARAGEDQQILIPIDNSVVTVGLDGSESSDDKDITSVQWKMTSGPQPITIVQPDSLKTTITEITKPGKYTMMLTVTDVDGASSSDSVVITVKDEQPPVADAGPDIVLTLPDNIVMLDGSKSTDDYGITEYQWTRAEKSPAAGYILNHSDHQAVLHIAGLVQGSYTFILKVTNIRGKSTTDEATVVVKPDPMIDNLVELHLDANILRFDEVHKQTVIRQLEVLLSLQTDDEIIVRDVFAEHGTGHMIVLFYVKPKDAEPLFAINVSDSLNSKLKSDVEFLEFKFLRADTYVCENLCSGHGRCHSGSHGCECDLFWMENFFRVYLGDGKRNCDWSVLYVGIATFIIITLLSCTLWFLSCYCIRKKKRKSSRKRRKNYTTHDKARYEKLPMKPYRNGHVRKNGYVRSNVAYKSSSIMRSLSSSTSSLSNSEEAKEHTLFERKRLLLSSNGGGRFNGAFDPIDMAKVKIRKSSSSSVSKNSNNSAQRVNANGGIEHQSMTLLAGHNSEENVL